MLRVSAVVVAAVALVLLTSTAALASDGGTAPGEGTGSTAEVVPAAAPAPVQGVALLADGGPIEVSSAADEASAEKRRLQRLQRRRMGCGCAMPRLFRTKEKSFTFDGATALAAWGRDDGTAVVEPYRTDEASGSLITAEAPLVLERFSPPAGVDLVESPYALFRTYADAEGEPFYIGLRTPPRGLPGDVVEAIPTSSEVPGPGPVAALEELWLGPVTTHGSDRCGEIVSPRLIVTPQEGAPAPVAYLVRYTPTGGPTTTALIDARHARIFGLGRVDPCDHGMPFEQGVPDAGPVPGEVEIQTVASGFALGPTWRWSLPPATGELPTPLALPEGVDLDLDDNPFLVAPRDPIEGILSDEKDHIAFGMMAFVMLGAAVFARILYAGRRRRGRHMVTLGCPVCDAQLSLDLEDPETDGLFCPKCGKSSIFVSFEADGTPKASVFKLEANASTSDDAPDVD